MTVTSQKIATFLSRAFEGRMLGPDDDIFAGGFGNSMFAMQLVGFVEKEFGIEIDADDLDIANFSTIARLTELVERKCAGSSAAAA
ncbi:acyl carrier protein [Sphingomonas sp. MMS12-HWE2-04]|uniref:acyl carrier protein n=1 Tax=Sphingomonas sp. MMS12-HWE2-04 TaxID=3234199 RepID=UPI00384AE825